MSVGFIVMAHNEPKLLGALLDELAPYPAFLHVDRPKLSDDYLNEAGISVKSNVMLNGQARCLHWGGYSILQAMLETLDLALKSTDSRTAHFAFLSGQCFPLRPVSEFVRYVESLQSPLLCRAVRLDGNKVMGPARVTRRHWMDGVVGHVKKTGPRRFVGLFRRGLAWSTGWKPVEVPELDHACGSQWSCLPRALAEELVEHYKLGNFSYLENAYAPDEIAIPSYVYNSRWRWETQVGALEDAGNQDVSAFPNFHWLRSRLEGDIDVQDVQVALNSSYYFIRKVGVSNHSEIIDAIKASW